MLWPLMEAGRITTFLRRSVTFAVVVAFGCLTLDRLTPRLAFGAQAPPTKSSDEAVVRAVEARTVDRSVKSSTSLATAGTTANSADLRQATAASGEQDPSNSGGKPQLHVAATGNRKPRTTLAKLQEIRAETLKRLESIDASLAAGSESNSKSSNSSNTPADDSKTLRELLKARLDWMNEYEKAERDYRLAAETRPEQDKAKARAELDKLNALLSQAGRSPTTILPQVFRGPNNEVGDAVRVEMKEAIEATQNELKDWTSKLEAAKGDALRTAEVRASMRAERDKIFQRVAAARARGGEHATGPSKNAKQPNPESQKLDLERKLNQEWEAQVESLRLMAQEAKIALEAKMTAVNELVIQVLEAHVAIGQKTLEQMQIRLRSVSDLQQRDLKRAAATEEKLAAKSDDPLERYRAQRTAELLEIEAQTVKFEQTLAANPTPSPEDQKARADQAKRDFEEIKQLLEDGEVSRLDAIRLNNDFRRVGPERERVARNEMTIVEARVQFYGNALTEAELELIEDSHQDRFEHEALLERLPASRRPAAQLVFEELNRKYRAILIRRRDALKQLANRAAETLREVTTRLGVLDDEYGFIRTSIFWVRDQDPIGPETIGQGGQEIARLGKGLFRVAQEVIDRRNWSHASAEFIAATAGLLILPVGLIRVRRKLGRRIAFDLPTHTATPAPADPVRTADEPIGLPHPPEPD